jgi:hypothetical protein
MASSVIFKYLSKESNCPIDENSPNLVTLIQMGKNYYELKSLAFSLTKLTVCIQLL